MFYAYILYNSIKNRFYTGQTEDIAARLQGHNSGKVKSTKSGAPWKLKHHEAFATRTEAVRKEMQIKKRGAKRYLENFNTS